MNSNSASSQRRIVNQIEFKPEQRIWTRSFSSDSDPDDCFMSRPDFMNLIALRIAAGAASGSAALVPAAAAIHND